jgi:hypothetical protein
MSVFASFALAALLSTAFARGEAAARESAASPRRYHLAVPGQAASGAFATRLQEALQHLARLAEQGDAPQQRRLARETLQRIEAGDILLGDVAHPLPQDLYRMCRDRKLDACPSVLAHPDEFSVAEADRAAIVAPYEGYMWGNRIYLKIGPGLSSADLAATLVHEGNHVLNRSECHYYSDLEEQILDTQLGYLEEYRAFVAECLFYKGRLATARDCDRYAAAQLEARGYSFETSASQIAAPLPAWTVAEGILRDRGRGAEERFGRLLPLASRFAADYERCAM